MSTRHTNDDGEQPATLKEASAMIRALRQELSRAERRRDKAEKDLRCFRELAEHIREVFWLTNPSGDTLVYISPAYEHIWGQTCDSLYENPGERLAWVHDADRERVLTAFKRDGAAGNYDETYRIDRPDGEIRWIRDRAFPVYDDNGAIYRLAGFALDITHQIEDSDRINRLHTHINGHERMNVFATLGTGLAHDLSQPLTAARNFIAGARHTLTYAGDAAQATATLGHADSEIERAVSVIRHLRDFAREGKPTLTPQPLKRLLDDVHQLMDPALRGRDIRYHGPDPDKLADLEVPLDTVFAQQVLRNLITNAIDAFGEDANDARSLAVDVHTNDDGTVDIEVADNGSGIGNDVDLFAPFNTTKAQGLGLGLAVSRSLARSHGGDLILASRGRAENADRTRFVLRLPRA